MPCKLGVQHSILERQKFSEHLTANFLNAHTESISPGLFELVFSDHVFSFNNSPQQFFLLSQQYLFLLLSYLEKYFPLTNEIYIITFVASVTIDWQYRQQR